MFWKHKKPTGIRVAARPVRKVLWDVNIKYEDGSEKKYESALSVYPIGQQGSHLRIEFAGPHFQSSFTIISLSHVIQVEGRIREEEAEPDEASIP